MRNIHWIGVAVVAIMLTACGGSKDASGKASGTGAAKTPARPGDASAEQVAKETRGNVNCPAKVATPVVAGGPVIDVVGLRPGITYEEAANIVLCDNPMLVAKSDTSRGFNIQTYGQAVRQGFGASFAEARVEKTSKQIMQELQDNALARGTNAVRQDMKPGQVKYYVGTMGVPGQERAIYATREEWFGEGKNPTVDSVAQALSGKYGPATETRNDASLRYMRWVYDPMGRKVTETSPLYRECSGVADPDAAVDLESACGVVVTAQIGWMPNNPGLAKYLQVGIVDQSNGYRAIKSTEDQLRQEDDARKAKELQEANKSAAKPKL